MDQSANHYELLGLPRKATQAEIKAAYKDLARIFHPDSNFYDEIVGDLPEGSSEQAASTASTELFQRITAAYEVLSNLDRRFEYDSTLPQGLRDWDEKIPDRYEHLERMKSAVASKAFGKAPVQFESAKDSAPRARKVSAMSQMLKKDRSAWGAIKSLLGFA